jgi:hypothetical protein
MNENSFLQDSYPGKPKILFIGESLSSHDRAWVDLFEDTEFNIRFFNVTNSLPPTDWEIPVYVTNPYLPSELKIQSRLYLYPTPEETADAYEKQRKDARTWVKRFVWKSRSVFQEITNSSKSFNVDAIITPGPKAATSEEWLRQIIQEWKPDIIHTFGINPSGHFLFKSQEQMNLPRTFKWVLQTRGGSDLTLTRFDPKVAPLIHNILRSCDHLVCDNQWNLNFAESIGVTNNQIAEIAPIPGTGGIEVERYANAWKGQPSMRRSIVWPKAYDCEWSVALPVFEAIKLAWDTIKPCKISMLAMTTEMTRVWYNALPDEIRQNCEVMGRISREDVFALMTGSRVMLAPSLVDGIPNSIYEAMACGAAPIISPLETITTVFENERNALFARNLYPDEIANALRRAMTDDDWLDRVSQENLMLVKRIANRSLIRPKVLSYYKKLSGR